MPISDATLDANYYTCVCIYLSHNAETDYSQFQLTYVTNQIEITTWDYGSPAEPTRDDLKSGTTDAEVTEFNAVFLANSVNITACPVTEAVRDSMNVVEGTLCVNTDTLKLQCYINSTWVDLN
jgi:hypothetical protein